MAQLLGNTLIFVGLACLSAAAAVLVGTLAFRLSSAPSRYRRLARRVRFTEARKITRVNAPPPSHAPARPDRMSPRAEAAPAYVPLRIRVRFRRDESLDLPGSIDDGVLRALAMEMVRARERQLAEEAEPDVHEALEQRQGWWQKRQKPVEEGAGEKIPWLGESTAGFPRPDDSAETQDGDWIS